MIDTMNSQISTVPTNMLYSKEQEQQQQQSEYETSTYSSSPVVVEQQKRKVATFATHARLRRTMHVNNYTDEEYKACWYSRSEMIRIRHDASTIATIMEAGYASYVPGKDAIEQKVSLLGLEHRTSAGRRRQENNRIRAWDAVFVEQERQKQQGIAVDNNGAEKIARIYSKISHACQVKATMSATFGTKNESALYKEEGIQSPASAVNQKTSPMRGGRAKQQHVLRSC